MQDARFYGAVPISLKSTVVVRSGVFDRAGTLLISELECLDTGIIWKGMLTPPGQRGRLHPTEAGFPKFYSVEGVEIDVATPQTVLTLEEISEPKAPC